MNQGNLTGRRAGVACLVSVALPLAVCGGAVSAGRASTVPSSRLGSAEFAFLVGFGRTARDQPLRDRAEQILDQRCMNKRGFKYIVGPAGSAARSVLLNEPYVPGVGATRTEALAVALRRRVGYHLYAAYHPGPVPPNDQYVRSLSPAEQARYSRALFGPQSAHQTIHEPGGGSLTFPTRGCVAQGQERLYGSPKAAQEVLTFPGDWLAQIGTRTTSDPAVVAKGEPWSRCASAAIGIHVATPDEIVQRLKRDYAREGGTRAMHRREIAYAVADARCQFRSGLAAVYATTLRRDADQLSRPTRRLLSHLLQVERTATQRARTGRRRSGARSSSTHP